MEREKGVAYCGLACCVCGENETCAGCRNEGCKEKEWCKSFQCCKQKGLNGCWECSEFPCDNPMFTKIRVRTFAKFIAEYGDEKLMNVLENNEKDGMKYHYPSQLIGDYDNFKTEEDLRQFLGRNLS
jgi:hypothetical protein